MRNLWLQHVTQSWTFPYYTITISLLNFPSRKLCTLLNRVCIMYFLYEFIMKCCNRKLKCKCIYSWMNYKNKKIEKISRNFSHLATITRRYKWTRNWNEWNLVSFLSRKNSSYFSYLKIHAFISYNRLWY